jgi:hypothetical protein
MGAQGYPKLLGVPLTAGEQKAKISRNLLMRYVLRLTSA